MAAVVTANVGNAIAGGVVLEDAPDLGYATWPEFIQKTTGQIIDIYAQRVAERGADPMANDAMQPQAAPEAAPAAVPAPILAGGTLGLVMLGAALYFLSR